jgi:hypothetical protein
MLDPADSGESDGSGAVSVWPDGSVAVYRLRSARISRMQVEMIATTHTPPMRNARFAAIQRRAQQRSIFRAKLSSDDTNVMATADTSTRPISQAIVGCLRRIAWSPALRLSPTANDGNAGGCLGVSE